jgi:DsbC/DsbD-like thiol-disulfide interchange protein
MASWRLASRQNEPAQVAAGEAEHYHIGEMKRLLPPGLAFAAAAAAIAVASPASAAVGAWIDADAVQLRLVASAGENGGDPMAAIEMRLAAGWKTYWRTPGAGGLPTLFDFGASRNLADVEVTYPAPRRYNDGYSATNVYEGRVVFPITMTAAVPTAPMTVHVKISFGVCETICIPLDLEASVTIAPNDVDSEALAIVNDGVAMLPASPVPGEFEVTRLARTGADDEATHFEAEVVVPEPFGTVLFVEGPAGWFATPPVETGRDGNRLTFAFDMEQIDSADPLAGAPLTFTLVSQSAAIEQQLAAP